MSRINLNQINIIDASNIPAVDGSVPVASTIGNHQWSSNLSSGVIIPKGTTAQRPSNPSNGLFRFNTDLNVFEIYVPTGWKSISQLTEQGTEDTPSRAFNGDENTGTFSPGADEWAVTTGGQKRIHVSNDGVIIYGDLEVTGDLTTSTGGSSTIEVLPIEDTTLFDNTPVPQTIGGGLVYNAGDFPGVYVDYLLKRGSIVSTGYFMVTNDGTNAFINSDSVSSGDIGVTFSAVIDGQDVQIQYTTTSTGTNVDARFSVRRWGFN